MGCWTCWREWNRGRCLYDRQLAFALARNLQGEVIMTTFTVGYLVGSLAEASINRKLALALVKLAPPSLKMCEIPIRDLPLYSYDFDKDFPPPGRALKHALDEVDAVIFVGIQGFQWVGVEGVGVSSSPPQWK